MTQSHLHWWNSSKMISWSKPRNTLRKATLQGINQKCLRWPSSRKQGRSITSNLGTNACRTLLGIRFKISWPRLSQILLYDNWPIIAFITSWLIWRGWVFAENTKIFWKMTRLLQKSTLPSVGHQPWRKTPTARLLSSCFRVTCWESPAKVTSFQRGIPQYQQRWWTKGDDIYRVLL